MKRNYFLIPVFIFTALICFLQNKLPSKETAPVYNEGVVERSNAERNMEAVRRISALGGIDTAVVLSRKGMVLAGIRLISGAANKEEIYRGSEAVLKAVFPKAKSCKISVDDDNAEDAIELSYYLETDMKKSILKKRFEYLMSEDSGSV